MKIRGIVTGALISLAVFLAFAIAGGVCLAAGFGELVNNSGVIETADDLFEYIDNYVDDFSMDLNVTADSEETTAYYGRTLSDEVESIVLETGGCRVDVFRGEEFAVEFTGSVEAGTFAEDTASGEDAAADTAAYYASNGVIDAALNGSELKITVNSATTVWGINASIGSVKVCIPESYTGSFELVNSFAEINVRGISFDELTFNSCMGEIDVTGCDVNILNIENLAGEFDAETCSIQGLNFKNIAGEINVDSLTALTADSEITNVAGEVSVELPRGTELNITREDILGQVDIDRAIVGGENAPYLEISDVAGEVSIELDRVD